jgi:endonuclease YncB( thermonuclease family)
MKAGKDAVAALLGLLALASLSCSAADESLTGRVATVIDGDTLTIVDEAKATHRIDLHGIDAPEGGQSFGAKASANLNRLAAGKTVRADCVKRSRRDTRLCTVWTYPSDCTACGYTLDLGLMQVLQGYAWHYTLSESAQSPQMQAQYSVAELEAKTKKAGLWGENSPVAPWDWRKKAR